MIQLTNSKNLPKGYRGLTVNQNPIKHNGETYNIEVQLSKTLVKQFIEYIEQLLAWGYKYRTDQKHREELLQVVEQYHKNQSVLYGKGEANFRFKHFMESKKGRYIEGLKGYGDTHYYRIK